MPADSFLSDFIAGWIAGGTGLVLGHPLDTIKVRLQALREYQGNTLQCVMQTFRQESITGFYKGMLFPFLTTGFLHSIYFGGHGVTLKLLKDPQKSEYDDCASPFGHQLTGAIVGSTVQWVPACPIEVVKTKLQIQKETFSILNKIAGKKHAKGAAASAEGRVLFTSPWDCLRKTVKHEGVAGLYRGGWIMLLRDVFGYCFYMPVYEYLKDVITKYLKPRETVIVYFKEHDVFGTEERGLGLPQLSHQQRVSASLVAGGIAGVVSWLVILPLDLIKSRLQADDIARPKYRGIWHCAVESFQTGGVGVFFRGWQVVFVRALPVNAVLLLTYDESLRFLNRHLNR